MRKSNGNITALGLYLNEQFDRFATNRKHAEAKWSRNYLAFHGSAPTDDASPSIVDPLAQDNTSTDKTKANWRSKIFIRRVKQKVLTLVALLTDSFFAAGVQLPIGLKLDESVPDDQRDIFEQPMEDLKDLIQSALRLIRGDRRFMRGLVGFAVYGEMWTKRRVFTVRHKRFQEVPIAEGVNVDPAVLPPHLRRWERVTEERQVPGFENVSRWDIYDDLQHEALEDKIGIYHRKLVSGADLRALKHHPFAVKSGIKQALSEIPTDKYKSSVDLEQANNPLLKELAYMHANVTLREYWGQVPKAVAEAFESDIKAMEAGDAPSSINSLNTEDLEDTETTEIMCILAHDTTVVAYTRTEPEDRPFMRAYMEDPLDTTYGYSVADNVEATQDLFIDTVRLFVDAKRLSSQPMLARKASAIEDDMSEIEPGKVFDIDEECEDVNRAIAPIAFPDVGNSLVNLITLTEGWLDGDSMLPPLLQGMMDSARPDSTAFEVRAKRESGLKHVSQITRNLDEGQIEPIAEFILEYLLDDPNMSGMPGPFQVEALGFSSFQDREVRLDKLRDMMQMILANETLMLEFKIEEIAKDVSAILDMDAEQYVRSEDEKAAMSQPSEAQQLEMAKMQAEIAETNAKAENAAADAVLARVKAEQVAVESAKTVAEANNPEPKEKETQPA